MWPWTRSSVKPLRKQSKQQRKETKKQEPKVDDDLDRTEQNYIDLFRDRSYRSQR